MRRDLTTLMRGVIKGTHTKEQVLEVIVAASTITNYTGTIANPPLEDAFRQHAGLG